MFYVHFYFFAECCKNLISELQRLTVVPSSTDLKTILEKAEWDFYHAIDLAQMASTEHYKDLLFEPEREDEGGNGVSDNTGSKT